MTFATRVDNNFVMALKNSITVESFANFWMIGYTALLSDMQRIDFSIFYLTLT